MYELVHQRITLSPSFLYSVKRHLCCNVQVSSTTTFTTKTCCSRQYSVAESIRRAVLSVPQSSSKTNSLTAAAARSQLRSYSSAATIAVESRMCSTLAHKSPVCSTGRTPRTRTQWWRSRSPFRT